MDENKNNINQYNFKNEKINSRINQELNVYDL